MSANRHFDEDDLVLYALRLLPESEQSAVARFVAQDPEARRRLGELQATLAVYAEATLEPKAVPEGSLNRLMERIAGETSRTEQPTRISKRAQTATAGERAAVWGRPFSLWLGWGLAAVLAVALGLAAQRWMVLRHQMFTNGAEIAALKTQAEGLRKQRDAVHSSLEDQENRAAALDAEASEAETKSAHLQAKLADQTTELEQQAARANRAENLKSQLQGTVAQQQNQLAQMSAATRDAQILAALTDPTALRVVLTKPRAKPAPTGRAAYIATKGTLVFLASNLKPLKPTKVYELWLMPADGSSPIPAGTFLPDTRGNANLAYAHFPVSVVAKGFAVTVENAGGSQVPTLPLVLAGS